MKENAEPGILDYDYVMSALGNAFFSGLSFGETWQCVILSENREEFDTAVSVTISLKTLVSK